MAKEFERMTPEQIEAAEQVSIVDYCMANGIAIKPDSGEDWRMVEPDSVVITGHKWNRTSKKPCPYTNFTGGSATQFVHGGWRGPFLQGGRFLSCFPLSIRHYCRKNTSRA
jgi:hypothetical protein